MKRVLMVAEKFPPFNVSGSARPFYFAKYLPDHGYLPTVLAARVPKAESRDESLLAELPREVQIFRGGQIVTPLSSSLTGGAARQPARWAASASGDSPTRAQRAGATTWLRGNWQLFGWWLNCEVDWGVTATWAAARAMARGKPELVWVSGPPFRGFEIGQRLARWLQVPLILDLRDPWTYGSLWRPKTPRIARAERARALRALSAADRVTFTSPLTQRAMAERFPDVDSSRWCTITNGYDDVPVEPLRDQRDDVCVFRYIGTLNPRRSPDVLIAALAQAAADPQFRATAALELIGNAGGHEHKASLAPGCSVRFRGPVSRAESLRLAFGSDVNVLLQTIDDGQDVVSGKAFEYLHAGKPILAVVDPGGGDAWLLRETGAGEIASFNDVDAVAAAMRRAWQAWRERRASGQPAARPVVAAAYSRRALAAQLAALFDDAIAQAGAARR